MSSPRWCHFSLNLVVTRELRRALVTAARHEFAPGENVVLERMVQRRTRRVGLQIQFPVDGEDAKVVAMSARGRAGPAVAAPAEVVPSLDRAGGKALLVNPRRARIDVPDKPVRKQTAGDIGIVHNQDEAFRLFRDATKLERRVHIGTLAGKPGGNHGARLEGRTADLDLRGHDRAKRERENETGSRDLERTHPKPLIHNRGSAWQARKRLFYNYF